MKIQENLKIKKIGSKLGRQGLSERAEEVVKKMMKDIHYQGLWEGIGRLCIIATAMRNCEYMTEKIEIGKQKEIHSLNFLERNITAKPKYYGYKGIVED